MQILKTTKVVVGIKVMMMRMRMPHILKIILKRALLKMTGMTSGTTHSRAIHLLKGEVELIQPSNPTQTPSSAQQTSTCDLTPVAGELRASPKGWRMAKQGQLRRMSQRRVPLRIRVVARVMQ